MQSGRKFADINTFKPNCTESDFDLLNISGQMFIEWRIYSLNDFALWIRSCFQILAKSLCLKQIRKSSEMLSGFSPPQFFFLRKCQCFRPDSWKDLGTTHKRRRIWCISYCIAQWTGRAIGMWRLQFTVLIQSRVFKLRSTHRSVP